MSNLPLYKRLSIRAGIASVFYLGYAGVAGAAPAATPTGCIIGDVRADPASQTVLQYCVPGDGSPAASQAGSPNGIWIQFGACVNGTVGAGTPDGTPAYQGLIPDAFVSCIAAAEMQPVRAASIVCGNWLTCQNSTFQKSPLWPKDTISPDEPPYEWLCVNATEAILCPAIPRVLKW